jgi:protein gp37
VSDILEKIASTAATAAYAANWQLPRKWNKEAAAAGVRHRVFCASMADVFDNQVWDRHRDDLWHLIHQTPHLDWLLLTKRPQNIVKMLPSPDIGAPAWGEGWKNVWLGTTVENQEEADRRIPHLLAVPAVKRFLSCEPLLGKINLISWLPGVDWVICGGESGPHARPMHPDWARSLRNQCASAGVPFFFKQWGEWAPSYGAINCNRRAVSVYDGSGFDISTGVRARSIDLFDSCQMVRAGKKVSGALLDGVEHRAFPTWNDQPATEGDAP